MTEQEKFYSIYRDYYFKFGKVWAAKVQSFENKKTNPFANVTREVNSAMRRYLGADKFGRYIDLLEYLILKDGFLVKDEENRLDITPATFNLWLE